MNIASKRCLSVVIALAAAALAPAALGHGILVAQSGSGQLKLLFEEPMPFEMEPTFIPGFPGFINVHAGFSPVLGPEPDLDAFPPSETSDIEFVLVAIDPGFQVWNDTGSAPMLPGQAFHCGVPYFMTHPLWQAPGGLRSREYAAQVFMRDRTAQHADSAVYTLIFATPRCPGDADRNGAVDQDDLDLVLFNFGTPQPTGTNGDVDDDGDVDQDDLDMVLFNFAAPC